MISSQFVDTLRLVQDVSSVDVLIGISTSLRIKQLIFSGFDDLLDDLLSGSTNLISNDRLSIYDRLGIQSTSGIMSFIQF